MTKKIIFDTDLGGDCDDVVALDLLLAAHKAGECDLLAVTYSYTTRQSPGCIYEILKQHGCREIPIGRMEIPEGTKEYPGTYAAPVVEKFGGSDTPTYESTPEAVRLLRGLLASNRHVTLAVTGMLTNLSDLLKSAPDEISPLDGTALVAASVDEVAVMGGNFCHEGSLFPGVGQGSLPDAVGEWNILCDIPAAQYVFENCPVSLVCLPFELGNDIFSGGEMCRLGKGETPDSYAMLVHGSGEKGRHSWDPCTALYALSGAAPWFLRSAAGQISVDGRGVTRFLPDRGGRQTVLSCALPREEIGREIDRQIRRLFPE